MGEETAKNSFGILNSLKKLIFEDSDAPGSTQDQQPASISTKTPEPVTNQPQVNLKENVSPIGVTDVKQMKVKVLGILEKMNEPGLDFFEVWNAAAEMGSIDASTIKAAYTSLKYVEKDLNKQKLLTTGRSYATELKKVIEQESSQKQQQKQNLENSLIDEKNDLINEIKTIEQNIADLKAKLQNKEQDLKNLNVKYDPQLKDIDQKIALGNAAVNEVIADIEKALSIIETNIN
ncbi:hypothetical protein G7074_26140 [Pedobacter sp. HDW13]|uniref:hypothetical protein n=1 Tax=unclassified Pedobacter TaxID=2628915 RepID=UPI000F59EB8D|nr:MULTISPECIES: hypothetical protein [unclassified Pedobacter]QIL42435.1 hypothetical protein G7074_26140 [Pedobacter sp. HDW13]RQO78914.1 hypothetical protein DBR40_04095 [Pedobacter sp. KBW01]